jgi:hypothetical protein
VSWRDWTFDAQKEAEKEEAQQDETYKIILATSQGQDMLDDLIRFSQEPGIESARLLGRADVVTRIMAQRRNGRKLTDGSSS